MRQKSRNSAAMKFLKKEREKRKLTKYGMAKFLGLLPQTYTNYEEKAKGMEIRRLCEIRRKLELSWTQFGKHLDGE